LQINSLSRIFRRCFRPLLALAACLTLAACTGKDPGDIQIKLTLGPAGGKIDLPLGIRLNVPSGALTQATKFTFRISSETWPFGGHLAVSKQFLIKTSPEVTFQIPAILRMSYDDSTLAGREAEVTPYRWDGAVLWEPLTSGELIRNEEQNTLHFDITSEGDYALFVTE